MKIYKHTLDTVFVLNQEYFENLVNSYRYLVENKGHNPMCGFIRRKNNKITSVIKKVKV